MSPIRSHRTSATRATRPPSLPQAFYTLPSRYAFPQAHTSPSTCLGATAAAAERKVTRSSNRIGGGGASMSAGRLGRRRGCRPGGVAVRRWWWWRTHRQARRPSRTPPPRRRLRLGRQRTTLQRTRGRGSWRGACARRRPADDKNEDSRFCLFCSVSKFIHSLFCSDAGMPAMYPLRYCLSRCGPLAAAAAAAGVVAGGTAAFASVALSGGGL